MAINDPIAWYCPTITGDFSDYSGSQADLTRWSVVGFNGETQDGPYAPALITSPTNTAGSTSCYEFLYESSNYAGTLRFEPVVQPSGDWAISFWFSSISWKNWLLWGDVIAYGTANSPWYPNIVCSTGPLNGTVGKTPTTDWVHIALSYDSVASEATVWLNGARSIDSQPWLPSARSGDVVFGTTINPPSFATFNGYGGLMDDMRLFDHALADADVTELGSGIGIVPSGGGGDDGGDGGGDTSGLGDELLWICPSLDTDKLDSPNLDDLSSGSVPINISDTDGAAVWTPNTDSGGSYLIAGDDSSRDVLDVFPNLTGRYITVACWLDIPVVSTTQSGVLFNIGSDDFNAAPLVTVMFKQNVFGGTFFEQWFEGYYIEDFTTPNYFGGQRGTSVGSGDNAEWVAGVTGLHHFIFEFDFAGTETSVSFEGPGSVFRVWADGVEMPYQSLSQGIGSNYSGTEYNLTAGGEVNYQNFYSNITGSTRNLPTDDFRIFDRQLSDAEKTNLASERGYGYSEGGPSEPVGLGDERLWYSATLQSDGANLGDYTSTDMQLKPDTNCTIESFDSGGNNCFQSPSRTDNWKTDPNFNIYAEQSDEMTLAGWISSDNLGSFSPLFGLGGDNSFKSYGLIMEATNTQKGAVSRRTASGPQITATSSTFLSSNAVSPTHIAFVYNVTDDSIKFYKDGVLFEDVSTTVLPLSNIAQNTAARFGVMVGNSSGGGTNTRFEDMRFFDRELSASEIAHLASAPNVQGSPDTPPPTTGFYNPFMNKIFNPNYVRRIG